MLKQCATSQNVNKHKTRLASLRRSFGERERGRVWVTVQIRSQARNRVKVLDICAIDEGEGKEEGKDMG